MYILTKGNLINIFGEDITKTNKEIREKLGIDLINISQKMINDVMENVIEVVDESKLVIDNYVLLTKEQANQYITDNFISYSIKNESLMAANINSKIADETINIDDMSADWSTEQELEFLYNAGVSGIIRKVGKLVE